MKVTPPLNYSRNTHAALLPRVALLLVSLLFSLGLAEIGLHFFYWMHHDHWLWQYQNESRVPYVARTTDARVYVLTKGFADPAQGLTIDDRGFRHTIPSPNFTKPMVVCLGDSVPFGAGVADAETLPSQLAVRIRKRGMDVSVLNAGTPSYNIRQSFQHMDLTVFPVISTSPVIAVILQAANDISLFRFYREKWRPTTTWFGHRISTGYVRPRHKSAIAHFVSGIRTSLTDSNTATLPMTESLFLDSMENDISHQLRRYESMNIPVILLPVNPYYYAPATSAKNERLSRWRESSALAQDWDPLVASFNRLLEDISRRHKNAYFFDVRKRMDREDRDRLFVDFIHLSPAGNRMVAKWLFQALTSKGLLPK